MRFTVSCLAMVLSGLITSPVLAEGQSGGVIYFSGMLVNDGCDIAPRDNQLSIQCLNSQGKMQEWMQPLAVTADLPASAGKRTFHWLNQQKNQGVITVSYR